MDSFLFYGKEGHSFMLSFLLKRKRIIGLFVTFIFVLGIYSFTKLDKELFPPLTFDQALVMVETDEMPAVDVEQFVTKPIEQAIESIEGVESYQSTSSIGNSTFYINMEKGNGNDITKEIETAVHRLQGD